MAEGLIRAMTAAGIAGRKILLARAAEARPVLPEALASAGADVSVVPLYRTLPPEDLPPEAREALEQGEIDLVTFYQFFHGDQSDPPPGGTPARVQSGDPGRLHRSDNCPNGRGSRVSNRGPGRAIHDIRGWSRPWWTISAGSADRRTWPPSPHHSRPRNTLCPAWTLKNNSIHLNTRP